MNGGKRMKNLSLNEKFVAIRMIDEGKKSVKEVVDHFQCGKSQIYKLLKEKDTIIEKFLSSDDREKVQKKERQSKYKEVNEILFEWFSAAKAKNFKINGPILKEKAKEIAEMLKVESFNASNGWLHKFTDKHRISFRVSGGGSGGEVQGSADQSVVENWFEMLKDIIYGYSPGDVANLDETALFFRILPDKAVKMKGRKLCCGYFATERFTLLLTAFADGKLETPMVIGRSENPRCFKNLKKDKLPVIYRCNKNAWLTNELFEEYLTIANEKMRLQNRNILLFLDNALAHSRAHYSNIRLAFLPPNLPPKTIATLQPLANGIVHNFKINYRTLLLKHCVVNASREGPKTPAAKLDVLNGISILNRALQCVDRNYIRQCFRNCGFVFDPGDETGSECDEGSAEEEYREIQRLMELVLVEGTERPKISAKEFVQVDENVCTEVDNIDLNSLINIQLPNVEVIMQTEEDMQVDEEEEEGVSSSDVIDSLRNLKNYAKMKGNNEFFNKVVELEFMFYDTHK